MVSGKLSRVPSEIAGFVERVDGRLRDEDSNRAPFRPLRGARAMLEAWWCDCNGAQPLAACRKHASDQRRTPVMAG
jgi:hypothetical protein